jgi:hypothetical protein
MRNLNHEIDWKLKKFKLEWWGLVAELKKQKIESLEKYWKSFKIFYFFLKNKFLIFRVKYQFCKFWVKNRYFWPKKHLDPKFQLLSLRFAKNEFLKFEISKKTKNFETFSIYFHTFNFLSFQSISWFKFLIISKIQPPSHSRR